MTERDWELYRLENVQALPDSPYKSAVIQGIHNKLRVLEMRDTTSSMDGGVVASL